jgi:hypothetical protein
MTPCAWASREQRGTGVRPQVAECLVRVVVQRHRWRIRASLGAAVAHQEANHCHADAGHGRQWAPTTNSDPWREEGNTSTVIPRIRDDHAVVRMFLHTLSAAFAETEFVASVAAPIEASSGRRGFTCGRHCHMRQ